MESYEKFNELCNKMDVTPYQVSKETGIATSTLTSWKQGTYTPKIEKLVKIAGYFGVSIDYFLDGLKETKNGESE